MDCSECNITSEDWDCSECNITSEDWDCSECNITSEDWDCSGCNITSEDWDCSECNITSEDWDCSECNITSEDWEDFLDEVDNIVDLGVSVENFGAKSEVTSKQPCLRALTRGQAKKMLETDDTLQQQSHNDQNSE